LEEYIDSPLRVYSSGMQMRLSFSIAIHANPDVLLIDEVLAVGDMAFQRKCLDRIEQVKASGCTIIVVSHDAGMARELCDEALWLRAGRLEAQGSCSPVIGKYLADADTFCWSHLPVANTVQALTPEPPPQAAPPDDTPEFEIRSVRLLDGSDVLSPDRGGAVKEIDTGDAVSLEIGFVARKRLAAMNLSVTIRRPDGLACCDISTQESPSTLYGVTGEGTIELHIDRLDLGSGLYDLEVCAFGNEPSPRLGFWHKASFLKVRSDGSNSGLWRAPHRWEIRQSAEAPRSSVAGVV
jgi:lipopolysaccharide transport system ATP-binding protein